MSDYVAAVATTIVCTVVFAVLLVGADIEAVKGDWANRRCEIPITLAAGLYKPSNDPRSRIEFSKDNFSFCMNTIATNVVQTIFAPLFKVAEGQANAQASMIGPFNYLRGMLKTAKDTFDNYMGVQFSKYKVIQYALARGWQHIRSAMGRVQGIAASFLYLGLSVQATLLNTMDATYRAILVFVGILVAMIILLWFILLPVIPAILTVLGVLAGAGVAGAAGLSGAFCVDPDALVVLDDGTIKPLHECQVGDILRGSRAQTEPNRITGILTVDATDEPIVEIRGIRMSGSHRVKVKSEWCLANEHPDAKHDQPSMKRLICLNTSAHEVPMYTKEGTLWVGDWEEVDSEEGRRAWIDIVHLQLNGRNSFASVYPNHIPLASPTILVQTPNGSVPIQSLQIGDIVLDAKNNPTAVKGIYEGMIEESNQTSDPEWLSDGIWSYQSNRWWVNGIAYGVDVSSESTPHTIPGRFLVTESETFQVIRRGKIVRVRDFTEVGASKIEQTYSMLSYWMNKK